MREYLFGLILVLFGFISCQKSSPVDSGSIKRGLLLSKIDKDYSDEYSVSLNDVQRFANCHCNGRTYSIIPLAKDTDTLLFIVNYENGWMLISGDKRTCPVLAESPDGFLDLTSAHNGILIWLDSMAEDIWQYKKLSKEDENDNIRFWKRISDSPPSKSKSIKTARNEPLEKWYAITYGPELIGESSWDSIPHLIPTQWGQDYPWNTKCPLDLSALGKCLLGCSATALGQMIRYTHFVLGKPNQLYHYINCTYSTINGSSTDIGFERGNLNSSSSRWNDMAISSSSPSGIEYAGDLMLDIGNRIGMEYSGNGSEAGIPANDISNYYGLSFTKADYSFAPVISNLNNSLPVLVSAYSHRGWLGLSYTGGHAWIIDGIHCLTRSYRSITEFECSENWINHTPAYDTFEELAQAYGIQDPNDQIIDCFNLNYLYLLMNWGYDGQYDSGYYGSYPTDDWYVSTTNYQYKRKIYYDFH